MPRLKFAVGLASVHIFLHFSLHYAKCDSVSPSDAFYNFSDSETTHSNETTVLDYTDYAEENYTESVTGLSSVDESTIPFDALESETSTESTEFQSTLVDRLLLDNICPCDLTTYSCDVNCCCDQECSEEDMKVFTECSADSTTYVDERYCYRKNIFYKNNTAYKGVISKDSSLFCIVKDNVKEKLHFKDIPPLIRSEDIRAAIKRGSKFSWPVTMESEDDIRPEGMKAGDALYIVSKSGRLRTWGLPSDCYGTSCDCEKPVYYIQDSSSSCIHYIRDLETECERKQEFSMASYTNFCLYNATQTSANDSQNKIENEFSPALCLMKINYPQPTYDHASAMCHNIVSSVRYRIVHGGVNGIQSVMIISYNLTSISSQQPTLIQKFSVDFLWNETQTGEFTKRSGNPGYRFGFPVISGKQADTNMNESNTSVIVPLGGLSVLHSDENGFCDSSRKQVLFGKNVQAGCFLKNKFTSCDDAKRHVADVLLSASDRSTHVGAFGNANISRKDEWVEIFSDGKYAVNNNNKREDLDACELITEMKIIIVYAAVGPLSDPQLKIIGALYKYSSPQLVLLSSVNDGSSSRRLQEKDNLYISTSVSFLDVSEPAVAIYKTFPIFDVRLPHDFFYPFLLSSSNALSGDYISCVVKVSFVTVLCMWLTCLH